MKILIDARMYGLEHAGIGRYVMNLINQLIMIDKNNTYLIIQTKSSKLRTQNYSSKVKTMVVDIPHYGLKEQVELPKILNRLDFDIAHFPHFNVPIRFNRPFVVTIHDLIKHTSTGMKTTTRNPLLYWLKYAGYKKVFNHAINASQKIIVPSNAVKDDLLNTYGVSSDKVVITYEGVDDIFKSQITNSKSQIILKKYKIKSPYLIYTGSAYPHKNLERLILALGHFNNSSGRSKTNLVIASSRNIFLERLMEYAKRYGVENQVKFLGFVPDEDLVVLYKSSRAFVFPSLSEGFGLPGLEAMASGCSVACSDIPVFHEIYDDSAIYFNPMEVGDMARVIREIRDVGESERKKMIKRGKKRIKNFSWLKMAEETLRLYESLNIDKISNTVV